MYLLSIITYFLVVQMLIFNILLSCDELLQDATSEGDAEEDAGSLAAEKAPVDAFNVKSRIKEALESMNAQGKSGTRVAAQIVMDSAEYKNLPPELRFESPNAVMLQTRKDRLHLPPKGEPLRRLVAFLSIVEARMSPEEPGKII